MPLPSRPRIAIISSVERDHDYPQNGFSAASLNNAYPHSIARAGGLPYLLDASGDPALVPDLLDGMDGIVLAGGPDVDPLLYAPYARKECGLPCPVRDAFEDAVLAEATRRDLPVLGICRGLQYINVWHGGSLHQDISYTGSDLKHANFGNSDRGSHTVTIADGSFLAEALGEGSALVNSFHHQVIDRLASGFTVAATAPDGLIEAIEARSSRAPIIAVQWHPEMMSEVDEASQRLFAWFVRTVCEHSECVASES